ncbi:MAG: protein translocase subunit SecF [Pseudomonadota bacterium]
MELLRPDTNYDFVGYRRYAYLFSTVLVVLALLSVPIKGNIRLGIDFTGGIMIQLKTAKPIHVDEIRTALEPVGPGLLIQKFSSSENEYIVRAEVTESGAEEVAKKVKELLEHKIGSGNVDIRGVEIVGPKVGKDLRQSAVWATIIALGMLLTYVSIRFGPSMAIGAVLCLIHDVVIIFGLFVWTGREFNLTILAALLTVIGYDINDTIVVCDRIRENLASWMRRRALPEVLNASINQTLSRTILTSGFTLLVVVSLMIFGTDVLRDFGFALFAGIFFGTYSSIFVATPLVLAWDRIMPIHRG